jgi:VWFA-related protein
VRNLSPIPVLFSTTLLLLLCGTPSDSAAGQSQSSSETIAARAAEVLVDVVVTDSQNRIVSDLSPRDFRVYEEGMPQAIASLELVQGGETRLISKPGARSPAGATGVQPSADRPANLVVLLLDYSTTEFENQKMVRDAAIKFIEKKLQPNDLLAILSLSSGLRTLSNFTGDKAQLISALQIGSVVASGMASERADLTRGIIAGELASGQGTFCSSPAGLDDAESVTARLSGNVGAALAERKFAERIAAQYTSLRSALDQRQTRNVLTAIRAIARGVEVIPGRKSLVLFSQGFPIAPQLEGQLHAVVNEANRSHVAVYAIDSSGLTTKELHGGLGPRHEVSLIAAGPADERMKSMSGETEFDRVRQAGEDLPEGALRYLSEATGGALIHNTNELGRGLERMEEETHSYYLLTYHPSQPKEDGSFRRIQVEVAKAGLSVRARNGYFAIPELLRALSPQEFQLLERARATEVADQMPLFVRTGAFREPGGVYRVPFILEAPAKALQFEPDPTGAEGRLQVLAVVFDGAGRAVNQLSRFVRYKLGEAEMAALEERNVSVMDDLRLPPGAYSLETVITDPATGRVARRRQEISLPAPDSSLAISSVLLSHLAEKVPGSPSGFLLSQGARIIPSAQCRFHDGDDLIFYLNVYDSHPPSAGPGSKVTVSLSLEREGVPVDVRLPSFDLTGSDSEPVPHKTLTRTLHVSGVSPGHYALVVEAQEPGSQQMARAEAPFEVIPGSDPGR